MDRPKRSHKKKADPAFVYGSASPMKKDTTPVTATSASGKQSKKNFEKTKDKPSRKKVKKGDAKASTKKETQVLGCLKYDVVEDWFRKIESNHFEV